MISTPSPIIFFKIGKIMISDSKCPISNTAISLSSAVWNFKSPVTSVSAPSTCASLINSEPLPAQNAMRFRVVAELLFV